MSEFQTHPVPANFGYPEFLVDKNAKDVKKKIFLSGLSACPLIILFNCLLSPEGEGGCGGRRELGKRQSGSGSCAIRTPAQHSSCDKKLIFYGGVYSRMWIEVRVCCCRRPGPGHARKVM